MSSNGKLADPAAVRAWARENGFEVKSRGWLPTNVVKAYNKVHKIKFIPGHFEKTILVKGRKATKNGRTVPVQVRTTAAEVRAAALRAGVQLGERGRIPAPVLTAFASGEYN